MNERTKWAHDILEAAKKRLTRDVARPMPHLVAPAIVEREARQDDRHYAGPAGDRCVTPYVVRPFEASAHAGVTLGAHLAQDLNSFRHELARRGQGLEASGPADVRMSYEMPDHEDPTKDYAEFIWLVKGRVVDVQFDVQSAQDDMLTPDPAQRESLRKWRSAQSADQAAPSPTVVRDHDETT